jgi:hypothetical protein
VESANFKRWFGKSKAAAESPLSPAIRTVIEELNALPFADRVRVFGSAAKPGATPKDLDVFIDLRGSGDNPEQFDALLRVARFNYGWLDPFLCTDDGLLVRNDRATGWVRAKNATALVKAMERDGVPLQALPVEGTPLIVYHGTNQDIVQFDPSRLGQNTRARSSTAFFFTESPAEACEFSMMAARTQIVDAVETERAIEALQDKIKDAEKVASRSQKKSDWERVEALYLELERVDLGSIQAEASGQNILPVYLSVHNPMVLDMEGDGNMDRVAEAIQHAREKGHDGVRILNVYDPVDNRPEPFTTNQWVVFRPEQIKSIFNSGRFDPNSLLLSDHRPAVTQTPAFRNWFGKSRVVDEGGKPLVRYHASSNEWEGDSFRRRKPAGGKASLGYHVGTARAAEERIQPAVDELNLFSWSRHCPHTIPVYVRIENPLRLRDIGSWHDPQWVLQALSEARVRVESVTLHAITRELKLMGYDGIVYKNNCEDVGSDSWIAFDPGQLKSAIGNSGAFDRNSDSLIDRCDPTQDEDEDESEVRYERQSFG